MNAPALDHEGTMVDAYAKMKPDSFKLQLLQIVLTAYYEDIYGVQGASSCPKTSTRWSSASPRTKRRPEQRHPHHPAAQGRCTGSRRRQGGASSGPLPSTASSPAPSPGGKGKRVAWGGRKNARS